MKKFISMVMAAAMVVSMVPATAFAAADLSATAKVVDVLDMTETEAKAIKTEGTTTLGDLYASPELQIKITNADYAYDTTTAAEFTLTLDNAEFYGVAEGDSPAWIYTDYDTTGSVSYEVTDVNSDMDKITVTATGAFAEDDKIIVDLEEVMVAKTKEGTKYTVTVKSKDLGLEATELVFATVAGMVLEAEVEDTVDVAEEEIVTIDADGITVEAVTGNLPSKLTLKLNKGFEFPKAANVAAGYTWVDDNELEVTGVSGTEVVLTGIVIEATTAKVGDVATIKVDAKDWEAVSVDVAVVVAMDLTISVDEDEDVPEMWSGANSDNAGLNADADEHWALEVTVKESVAASFDNKDEIEFTLPDGVYVTDLKAVDENATLTGDLEDILKAAYVEGDFKSFVIEKRTLNETTVGGDAHEFTIELELVADPGFVGDVTMEMLVDGESKGEVTIATFKAPVVIEAQANDLKIDYRNTEIGSDIVIKEAEAGLLAKNTFFSFNIDKFDDNCWEDDMEYTTNEDDSDMTVEGEDDTLKFVIDEESDEEAGVITISNMSLYMERNIPAGAYDLTMTSTVTNAYGAEALVVADHDAACTVGTPGGECDDDCIEFVGDITDADGTVKEGFVNVVTAGREQDDASFTTKVVVPVGEAYIVAGEATVALDVPAYVSAAGYTMLPVRAVATALGISNNNVLWDAATKTVTILYGQRIITMQVGGTVVNVNGSAIPASASVEVVNGRTFLPMRDLATALGVTNITWDQATKTATLNG